MTTQPVNDRSDVESLAVAEAGGYVHYIRSLQMVSILIFSLVEHQWTAVSSPDVSSPIFFLTQSVRVTDHRHQIQSTFSTSSLRQTVQQDADSPFNRRR